MSGMPIVKVFYDSVYNRSANHTKVELTSESMPLKMHRKSTWTCALNRYNVKGMSIKRNIHWLVYNSTPRSFVMITTHHECMSTYTSTVCWHMTNLLAIHVLPVSSYFQYCHFDQPRLLFTHRAKTVLKQTLIHDPLQHDHRPKAFLKLESFTMYHSKPSNYSISQHLSCNYKCKI